ncbi:MAG: hypothetical protein M0P12_00605 [Paludibacteraceae bacterium]|nr:hypothetical protein [Paludibacteraceae bacterium]
MGNVYHRIEDVPEWIRPFIEERTIKSIDIRTNKNVEYKYFGKLPIPINEMLIHENELNKHLKWDVSGTCYSCGNHFVTTWNSLLARKNMQKKNSVVNVFERNNLLKNGGGIIQKLRKKCKAHQKLDVKCLKF